MCSNISKYAALFFTSRYNNACINAAQEILSIVLWKSEHYFRRHRQALLFSFSPKHRSGNPQQPAHHPEHPHPPTPRILLHTPLMRTAPRFHFISPFCVHASLKYNAVMAPSSPQLYILMSYFNWVINFRGKRWRKFPHKRAHTGA